MSTSLAITIPLPVADKSDSVPITKPLGILPNPQETTPNVTKETDRKRHVSNLDLENKLLKEQLQSRYKELALYLGNYKSNNKVRYQKNTLFPVLLENSLITRV